MKPKRVGAVFDNADSNMQVQIARLCVLYEDLRIEGAGATEDSLQALDVISAAYRKMYFVRRSVATLVEMASALRQLASDPEFKDLEKQLDDARRRQWRQASKYFAEIHRFLHDERNMYGGHFQDDAAAFALRRLEPDHVIVLDIAFNSDDTHNTTFPFAHEFVSLGFTANRQDRDAETYIEESFRVLLEAMRHATTAVHILEEVFLIPRFGF